MSKTTLITIFVLLTATGYPQKNYFILIQSNNRRIFFVNNDNKILNPSSIINFIESDTIPKNFPPVKKDDAFSRLMAGVVNDTAILYNSYVDVVPKKDTVKMEAVKKPVIKVDSPVAVVSKKDTGKSEVEKKPVLKIDSAIASSQKEYKADSLQRGTVVINKEEKKKDSVQIPQQRVFAEKLYEQKNDSTLKLIYADINKDGKCDTVYMVIPLEESVISKQQTDTVKKIAETIVTKKDSARGLPKDTALAVIKQDEKTNAGSLITPKVSDSVKKDSAVAEKKTPSKIFAGNTNCKNTATDYDVDKLRVKMLAVENEDDKIMAARKFFRIKCFSTNQIKALSEVFPTDEGRYKLFDTAYPYVSDYGNYPQLSTLLTSQYYINRFSAMIKQ
jgi:uncharacterized protein DUF4476